MSSDLIHSLNVSAASWAETMLRICWQGGLLVLLAWLLVKLARRIPARVCVAIWLVVCLRMLVGFSPYSVSLPVLPSERVVQSPVSSLTETPSSPFHLPKPAQPPAEAMGVLTYLEIAWLAGIAVIFASGVVGFLRARAITRRSEKILDPVIAELAEEAASVLQLPSVPNLLLTDEEVGAVTVGAFRPFVVLSRSLVEGCSREELKMVLAHEFAHIRRGDAWLTLIPQLTTALFFFHPCAWLASREFEWTREAACDELAIQSLRASSGSYGRLLLKLGSRKRGTPLFALPMSSHFRALSRRITMLDQVTNTPRSLPPRKALLVLAACALLVPWSLVRAQSAASPETFSPSAPSPKLGSSHAKPPKSVTGVTTKVEQKREKKKKVGQKETIVNIAFRVVNQPAKLLASRIDEKFGKKLKDVTPQGDYLFVQAPASVSKQVLDELVRLDQPQGEKNLTVFALRYAACGDVAKVLQNEFVPKGVKIQTDPASNSVVVVGSASATKGIQARIKQLDHANPSLIATYSLVFEHAKATEVGPAVAGAFKDRKPVVVVDPAKNSMLVRADPTLAAQMIEMAKRLDRDAEGQPAEPALVVKKYKLQHVDAKTVCEALKADAGSKNYPSLDFVSYDPTDNSVVCRATEEDAVKLAARIAALDKVP